MAVCSYPIVSVPALWSSEEDDPTQVDMNLVLDLDLDLADGRGDETTPYPASFSHAPHSTLVSTPRGCEGDNAKDSESNVPKPDYFTPVVYFNDGEFEQYVLNLDSDAESKGENMQHPSMTTVLQEINRSIDSRDGLNQSIDSGDGLLNSSDASLLDSSSQEALFEELDGTTGEGDDTLDQSFLSDFDFDEDEDIDTVEKMETGSDLADTAEPTIEDTVDVSMNSQDVSESASSEEVSVNIADISDMDDDDDTATSATAEPSIEDMVDVSMKSQDVSESASSEEVSVNISDISDMEDEETATSAKLEQDTEDHIADISDMDDDDTAALAKLEQDTEDTVSELDLEDISLYWDDEKMESERKKIEFQDACLSVFVGWSKQKKVRESGFRYRVRRALKRVKRALTAPFRCCIGK